jgi:hypothetical protein
MGKFSAPWKVVAALLVCASAMPVVSLRAAELVNVTINRTEIGDLTNVLHIKKLTGSFEFDVPVRKVTLVCQYYKKRDQVEDAPELKATIKLPQPATSGKFALHITDIDYIQLGDAPKNHCRVTLELAFGSLTLNPKDVDVPKHKFDLSQPLLGNAADFKTAHAIGWPIFTFAGKTRLTTPSTQVMLDENPNAEILIGYLEFEE